MNILEFMLQHPDVYAIEVRKLLAINNGEFTDISMRVDRDGRLFGVTRTVNRRELELFDESILDYLYAKIEKEIPNYENRKA